IPFEAAEEEKVLAQGESAFLASASSESQPGSPRTLSKKSRRLRLLRGARWQWLAPAGALAAGLLVWIALHENQSLAPPSLKQVQVATSRWPLHPHRQLQQLCGSSLRRRRPPRRSRNPRPMNLPARTGGAHRVP